MNAEVGFAGRMLFLSENLDAVRRQLRGENLALADCMPLRDDVSTDEITPTTVCLYYDERLARYAHIGFKVGGEMPIGVDAVRNGGFTIVVAGKRYGKGSSRETSPLAEKAAGIRLIVAESFERIYRQNADNIGILTTTDFTILARIAMGEAIALEAFLAGRDEVTQEVIRAGGLLKYSKTKLPRIRGVHVAPPPDDGRPRTLVDKIIARRKVAPAHDLAPGEGMFISTDWRFSHDHFTGMCAHFIADAFGPGIELERPDEIIAIQDHLILASESFPHVRDNLVPVVDELHAAHRQFAKRYGTRSHGQLEGEKGSEGICHPLLTEKYALPGQVVVGTDSHTPHSGALGCLAFGAGATDIANSYVTGLIRFRNPEVIRVELTGRLRPGVLARDIVQYLLQTEPIKQGHAIGAVFEYAGETVEAMAMDDRATLTNLVAELGGLTGIVAPDDKTVAFLRALRGVEVERRRLDALGSRCPLQGNDPHRLRRHPADGRAAGRPRELAADRGLERARARRHRARRLLHGGQARRLRCLSRSAEVGPRARAARRRRHAALSAIRHARRARLLRVEGLRRDDRGGRRRNGVAGLRRLRQLRPRPIDAQGPGDDQLHQSQFPGPLRTGERVARQSVYRRGERAGGLHYELRGPEARSRRNAHADRRCKDSTLTCDAPGFSGPGPIPSCMTSCGEAMRTC